MYCESTPESLLFYCHDFSSSNMNICLCVASSPPQMSHPLLSCTFYCHHNNTKKITCVVRPFKFQCHVLSPQFACGYFLKDAKFAVNIVINVTSASTLLKSCVFFNISKFGQISGGDGGITWPNRQVSRSFVASL